MEYVNNTIIDLISNSQIAFINEKYQEAFSLANKAIVIDPNCADAYQCAANVCMSLERYEDAIEYYQKAVKCEPNNGNVEAYNLLLENQTNTKYRNVVKHLAISLNNKGDIAINSISSKTGKKRSEIKDLLNQIEKN